MFPVLPALGIVASSAFILAQLAGPLGKWSSFSNNTVGVNEKLPLADLETDLVATPANPQVFVREVMPGVYLGADSHGQLPVRFDEADLERVSAFVGKDQITETPPTKVQSDGALLTSPAVEFRKSNALLNLAIHEGLNKIFQFDPKAALTSDPVLRFRLPNESTDGQTTLSIYNTVGASGLPTPGSAPIYQQVLDQNTPEVFTVSIPGPLATNNFVHVFTMTVDHEGKSTIGGPQDNPVSILPVEAEIEHLLDFDIYEPILVEPVPVRVTYADLCNTKGPFQIAVNDAPIAVVGEGEEVGFVSPVGSWQKITVSSTTEETLPLISLHRTNPESNLVEIVGCLNSQDSVISARSPFQSNGRSSELVQNNQKTGYLLTSDQDLSLAVLGSDSDPQLYVPVQGTRENHFFIAHSEISSMSQSYLSLEKRPLVHSKHFAQSPAVYGTLERATLDVPTDESGRIGPLPSNRPFVDLVGDATLPLRVPMFSVNTQDSLTLPSDSSLAMASINHWNSGGLLLGSAVRPLGPNIWGTGIRVIVRDLWGQESPVMYFNEYGVVDSRLEFSRDRSATFVAANLEDGMYLVEYISPQGMTLYQGLTLITRGVVSLAPAAY